MTVLDLAHSYRHGSLHVSETSHVEPDAVVGLQLVYSGLKWLQWF